MYRNEEASDLLINKLERQSLPSFSTIVGTGGRVLRRGYNKATPLHETTLQCNRPV